VSFPVRTALWGVVAALVLLVIGAFVAMELGWTRTFTAPYPPIVASTAPEVIERGRYLVYGPAACAYCHVVREQWKALDGGAVLPLTGAHVFPLPFGQIFSGNITPDPNTGIGRRTDGELARIMRFGVRADGRAAVPLMEYQGLSDEDLTAVVSFIRTQNGVRNQVPAHRLSVLGKALTAFAIDPTGPAEPPPHTSPSGLSVAAASTWSPRYRPAGRATPTEMAGAHWWARPLPAASAWTWLPTPRRFTSRRT
jgi:hypothetical protein